MNLKNNSKKTWAILCSGWGANANDIIEEVFKNETQYPNFTIKLLIHDTTDCGAAETANKFGIDTLRISRTDYNDAQTHQKNILLELKKRKINFIFLMNYKYLIRKELLLNYPKHIINVHPSLFPSFLATKTAIQDALDFGVKVTGITTHIIDDKFDQGEILFQIPIKIMDNDNFESLYPKFRKKGKKIIIKTIQHLSK